PGFARRGVKPNDEPCQGFAQAGNWFPLFGIVLWKKSGRPFLRIAIHALRLPTAKRAVLYAVCCRFRNMRARLMVRAFGSAGSFQGNPVISALGQSDATSIDVTSGCAATSSGSTSIGVWQDFAKSRDTLYTKSGRTRYRLCRYLSIVSIGTSRWRSRNSLAQTSRPALNM